MTSRSQFLGGPASTTLAPSTFAPAATAVPSLGDFIRSETTRWNAAIRELGVKVA